MRRTSVVVIVAAVCVVFAASMVVRVDAMDMAKAGQLAKEYGPKALELGKEYGPKLVDAVKERLAKKKGDDGNSGEEKDDAFEDNTEKGVDAPTGDATAESGDDMDDKKFDIESLSKQVLPDDIFGGLFKGDDEKRTEVTKSMLEQAVLNIGNGFNIAKAVQVIDGGEVIGQFQRAIVFKESQIEKAIRKRVLEIESSVSQDQCTGGATIETDEMSTRSRLWAELGFKIPLQGVGGDVGVKGGFGLKENIVDLSKSVNVNTKCLMMLFTVNITPKGSHLKRFLDRTFLEEWYALPTSLNQKHAKADFFDFFNRYGTHWVRAGTFGGLTSLTASIDSTVFKVASQVNVKMGVSAMLYGVEPKVKSSTKAYQMLEYQKSKVDWKLKVAGGNENLIKLRRDPSPIGITQLGKWKQTIPTNIARVAAEVGTLAELMNVALKGDTDKTEENKNRAALFELILKKYYEPLVLQVQFNRNLMKRLKGVLDDYQKTMIEVKKISMMQSVLVGPKLLGKSTIYSLSRTFDGVGSAVCHNVRYVCSQYCLAQRNVNFIQNTYFDVHQLDTSTDIVCMSSCMSMYTVGCTLFSIKDADFVSRKKYEATHEEKIGLVYKRSKRSWRKTDRWLKRTLHLSKKSLYYDQNGDGKRLKIINLNSVEGIVKVLPKDMSDGFGFQVISSDRCWIFKCVSEGERDKWIDAIMTHWDQFGAGAREPELVTDFAAGMRSTLGMVDLPDNSLDDVETESLSSFLEKTVIPDEVLDGIAKEMVEQAKTFEKMDPNMEDEEGKDEVDVRDVLARKDDEAEVNGKVRSETGNGDDQDASHGSLDGFVTAHGSMTSLSGDSGEWPDDSSSFGDESSSLENSSSFEDVSSSSYDGK